MAFLERWRDQLVAETVRAAPMLPSLLARQAAAGRAGRLHVCSVHIGEQGRQQQLKRLVAACCYVDIAACEPDWWSVKLACLLAGHYWSTTRVCSGQNTAAKRQAHRAWTRRLLSGKWLRLGHETHLAATAYA